MSTTGIDQHLEHLEAEFHEAAMNIYQRAIDEAGYTAPYYRSMVIEHGGRGAAKRLLQPNSKPQSGFTELLLGSSYLRYSIY